MCSGHILWLQAGTNYVSSYTPCLDTGPDCIDHTSRFPVDPSVLPSHSLYLGTGHQCAHPVPPVWDARTQCVSLMHLHLNAGILCLSHIYCLDARTWAAAYGWTSCALHKLYNQEGMSWGNSTCALLTEPGTLVRGCRSPVEREHSSN